MKKKPEKTWNPALYILMRDDMDSLNPGKAVAQGAHAANLFDWEMENVPQTAKFTEMHTQWVESGSGFGVTLCVSVNYHQLHGVIAFLQDAGYPASIVHDPSYPLLDGKTLHLLPLDTCGYVFGDKEELAAILRQYDLYP